MLEQGTQPRPEDAVTPEKELKDPFVLEFLDLKDEYSENDLEEALIRHIESFLLHRTDTTRYIISPSRYRVQKKNQSVYSLLGAKLATCSDSSERTGT